MTTATTASTPRPRTIIDGDYAPGRHEHGYYDLSGVAEEHHRHYDLERELASVRRDLEPA